MLIYLGAGWLWLWERGWYWPMGLGVVWVASYTLGYMLADRWTRSGSPILPPLDWNAPRTFSPKDRAAWEIVERTAQGAETLDVETLSGMDIYVETGQTLADALARHYHPTSQDPVENVPIIELLSALELAAEDLASLCREIPGGEILTPGHCKQAAQAANYIQKANDIYSIVLPFFSPTTGLARYGAQKLISGPAWKRVRQSLLRWFYRAYVNRLGHHLVELYSGRLAIGAENYRRLSKRVEEARAEDGATPARPRAAIVGAPGAETPRWIEAIKKRIATGDLEEIQGRLIDAGLDPRQAERLAELSFVEVSADRAFPDLESSRGRSRREEAINRAADADLLVLVAEPDRPDFNPEPLAAFAGEWSDWFEAHPDRNRPPGFVLLIGVSGRSFRPAQPDGKPRGVDLAEIARRLEEALPEGFGRVLIVEPAAADAPETEVSRAVLTRLARRLPEMERLAVLRHLQHKAGRSKTRRVIDQLGRQGRKLWSTAKTKARRRGQPAEADAED